MKNHFKYLILFLSILVFTASSCHKEDPEPDLVPITTTGANTMGFYVNGVPVNIRGEYGGFTPKGVTGGISPDNILDILGGGEPKVTLTIDLLINIQEPLREYELKGSDYKFDRVSLTKAGTLGGTVFFCDSLRTGKLKLLRMEQNMAAGTFYFDAIDPETGNVIKVTDGRFDIKFF